MHLLGLIFRDLESSGNLLSTRLLGHAFLCGPSPDANGDLASGEPALMLMSHPTTAVARKLDPGSPQALTSVRISLQAGLALNAVQAEPWGLQIAIDETSSKVMGASTDAEDLCSPVPVEHICLDDIAVRLRGVDLDALVMPANRGGVHAIVVRNDRLGSPWVELIDRRALHRSRFEIDHDRAYAYAHASYVRRRRASLQGAPRVQGPVPDPQRGAPVGLAD